MGIWNSHTSVGNILGGLVAGAESNSLDTWYVTRSIGCKVTSWLQSNLVVRLLGY